MGNIRKIGFQHNRFCYILKRNYHIDLKINFWHLFKVTNLFKIKFIQFLFSILLIKIVWPEVLIKSKNLQCTTVIVVLRKYEILIFTILWCESKN